MISGDEMTPRWNAPNFLAFFAIALYLISILPETQSNPFVREYLRNAEAKYKESADAGLEQWKHDEVMRSLTDNIVSKDTKTCKWVITTMPIAEKVTGSSPPPLVPLLAADDKISIGIYHPSPEEHRIYRDLPKSLTVANEALYYGKVKGKPAAQIWANDSKANNWQLPASHPRNSQKQRCVDLAREAYEKRSPPRAIFYEESRYNNTLFYMIRAKKAFIHDTGFVGLGGTCGYLQMHEGCETIFRFLGRKWHEKCHTHLRRSLISWNSLFVSSNLLNMADTKKPPRNGDPPPLFSSILHSTSSQSVDVRDTILHKFAQGCGDKDMVTKNFTLPVRYNRVFVATALWDHNYHHFLVDSVARIVRHIDFLRDNPDIKIHIRRFESKAKKLHIIRNGIEMRERIWKVLNISLDRIISGPVLATEVFLPRAPLCNAPMQHALELRVLANLLLPTSSSSSSSSSTAAVPAIGTSIETNAEPKATTAKKMKSKSNPLFSKKKTTATGIEKEKKNLIVQHRPCLDRKKCLESWREWDNSTAAVVVKAVTSQFPNHNVILMRADDPRWMYDLQGTLSAYRKTDVVVGLHGAGMTNMMWMQPGGLVVEIMGKFDGRMLPLCGYHGPLAAAFGVHHYLYYYDWKGGEAQDFEVIAREARRIYDHLPKQEVK